jgi:hypothetical protein
LAEFVSRLSAALMNVHDLPAAIKLRSRSFSSNVQRILGMTRSFLRPQPELDRRRMAASLFAREEQDKLDAHKSPPMRD